MREADNGEKAEKMKLEDMLCFTLCFFVFHFDVVLRNFYFFLSLWCCLATFSRFIINFYINYIFSLL